MDIFPLHLIYGNYELTLDEKNRLLIPSEIRKAIDPATDGEAFFLVTGINGKPWLYPEKYYESMALKRQSEMAPEEDFLAFDHMNFSTASRVEWDKQGRILIPEKIVRKSRLDREVTVIGVRDHAEIWRREEWMTYEEDLTKRNLEIAVRARQKTMGM
jgi:MraZ protein